MTSGVEISSGMRYAMKRNHSVVAYCALGISCGTRDEEGFHSGIAHFAEHAVFKGTIRKNASTINGFLDKLGGELNAYTTKEEIVLHATVLKEDLKKAVSLLFELVACPIFPEREIETERGVVIEEIKSYKDSPADNIYDCFEESLFAGHPLSEPILGTEESVNAITSEELRRFVREKFRPDHMAFTVVADLPEEKMSRLATEMTARYFPNGKNRGLSEKRRLFMPAASPFNRTEIKNNFEVNAVIGGLAPSLYEERERYAAILLCNILGGPASNSVLNSILRERHGWVYSVEASYTQYSDTGILAICLGCEKSNLKKCCAAIDRAIVRLQDNPLPESKLKAAKKQLLGQLAISSANGESQCLGMGKNLLAYGGILPDAEIRSKVEAVTAEEIMAMTRRILSKKNRSRLVFI